MNKASVKILCSLIVLMGGCLGAPAPSEQFYRLEVSFPTVAQFKNPLLLGTLQIMRPRSDALTGERNLLYRVNAGTSEVHRHAYHRWIDSPTRLLQQQITNYLRHSGMAKQVVTPELRIKADYRLTCYLTRLERIVNDHPRVIMELELGLTHIKNREAILLETYSAEQPAQGLDIASSIVAYNQALENILGQFLKRLSTVPSTIPVTHHP